MQGDEVLDEAYEQLSGTGPEYRGWLANHGPMAADALFRLGHGDEVSDWVTGYRQCLQSPPDERWPISEERWRDPFGDPSRLGDWLSLFTRLLREEQWEQVLLRWWPRLLPGAVASSAHGLIRTGHVVRALRERVSPARLDELAQALGYWAARWHPIPGYPFAVVQPNPALGNQVLQLDAALEGLPYVDMREDWGARARLEALDNSPHWATALSSHTGPSSAAEVPAALDALTDAAITRYGWWSEADPVMLVHAATAPRAVNLILPTLPTELWRAAYEAAWAVSAAITVAYRPAQRRTAAELAYRSNEAVEAAEPTVDDLAELAAHNRDEHVLKFVEVAIESHRRGNQTALGAGLRAVALIEAER